MEDTEIDGGGSEDTHARRATAAAQGQYTVVEAKNLETKTATDERYTTTCNQVGGANIKIRYTGETPHGRGGHIDLAK